ncbi:MobV family relaxase [Nostoc sp. MG11]|uniref:MobV family relaxase n=1 Tax=Nostoc sp. MG11 TaxID=2721166 RepID=UPI001867E86F|nr:MobV family relaxase [Nostoc sp. MG11]
MPYAIARIKKLKRVNIAGSASHTSRERDTPNADPTKENVRFIGEDKQQKLEDLVLAKITEHPQTRKIRKDAVYCVEFLLTASPEYFRPDNPIDAGAYDSNKLNAWLQSSHEWLIENYGSRIIRADLHLDEVTPHIHAYFVPLDESGQLRCYKFFGDRKKMHEFQNSYFEATQELGLERGLKGSRATHNDIKDFYSIVERGVSLDLDMTLQTKAKAADRDRAKRAALEMEATAKAVAKENEELVRRVNHLEQENLKLKQENQKLRQQSQDLPLTEVAWHLGRKSDRVIEGETSLEMVMRAAKCNIRQAIAWVNNKFGEPGMMQAVTFQAKKQAKEIVQNEPVPKIETQKNLDLEM